MQMTVGGELNNHLNKMLEMKQELANRGTKIEDNEDKNLDYSWQFTL